MVNSRSDGGDGRERNEGNSFFVAYIFLVQISRKRDAVVELVTDSDDGRQSWRFSPLAASIYASWI